MFSITGIIPVPRKLFPVLDLLMAMPYGQRVPELGEEKPSTGLAGGSQ